jgi:hypothetical protein
VASGICLPTKIWILTAREKVSTCIIVIWEIIVLTNSVDDLGNKLTPDVSKNKLKFNLVLRDDFAYYFGNNTEPTNSDPKEPR